MMTAVIIFFEKGEHIKNYLLKGGFHEKV